MFSRLIAEIIFSWIFKATIPQRIRDKITPWVLAGLLTWTAITPFVPTRIFFFGVLFYYLAISFLTDGYSLRMCSRNGVLLLFLLFWGWMLVSMFFGKYAMICFSQYLIILFELISVGYFVGMWALRTPGGMERIVRAAAVCFTLVTFFYIVTGSLSPEAMDANMRAGVNVEGLSADIADRKSNVNWIGLSMIGLLPYLFLYVLGKQQYTRMKWMKIVGVVNVLVLTLLLIRTGARNACLGLLPIAWYFIFAKSGGNRAKRMAIFSVLVIFLGLLIVLTTSSISNLRVFSYEKGTDLNQFSSGRIDWYINYYNSAKVGERWFGSGGYVDITETGQIVLGNYHSVYFQIFRQSGYVGSLLFALFAIGLMVRSVRMGTMGRLALMLFGVWALTGVGEAQPILRGGSTKVLLGLAVALCSRKFRQLPCVVPFRPFTQEAWRFPPKYGTGGVL